jgi:hypothetical protein
MFGVTTLHRPQKGSGRDSIAGYLVLALCRCPSFGGSVYLFVLSPTKEYSTDSVLNCLKFESAIYILPLRRFGSRSKSAPPLCICNRSRPPLLLMLRTSCSCKRHRVGGVEVLHTARLARQNGRSRGGGCETFECASLIRHRYDAKTDARPSGASEVPLATRRMCFPSEKASLRCKEGIVWFDSLTTS